MAVCYQSATTPRFITADSQRCYETHGSVTDRLLQQRQKPASSGMQNKADVPKPLDDTPAGQVPRARWKNESDLSTGLRIKNSVFATGQHTFCHQCCYRALVTGKSEPSREAQLTCDSGVTT